MSSDFFISFIKTNSSLPIFELIKAVKIESSTIFNLDYAKDNIFSCFLFFFLIIDLYFLIPTGLTQIFNPIAELGIPIEKPTKEAKLEMKTHPLIVEIKTSKCSI